MKLALLLLAGLAPLLFALFAAAMIGVFQVAARERQAEEHRSCPYCEFRNRPCAARMNGAVAEFRWANENGANGMPYPEELEWLGYRKVARHPAYPLSWLMRRDA